jgi:hypothetical protein
VTSNDTEPQPSRLPDDAADPQAHREQDTTARSRLVADLSDFFTRRKHRRNRVDLSAIPPKR